MKIQKSPLKTMNPYFFKDFPAKNIPFENASPKNGKFIDWNFTSTVLGDANGVLGFYVILRITTVFLPYYRVMAINCQIHTIRRRYVL